MKRNSIRSARGGLILAGILGVSIAAGHVLLDAWSRSDLIAPAPTLIITDRHGRFLTEVGRSDPEGHPFGDSLGFWPMDPMPKKVVAVTLAAEDRRFFEHFGVDMLAIVRAGLQNLRGGRRISGASTVAMQVARMQDPGPRTYSKKAREAITAVFLVARHGRERVLEHYLRVAPYGNRMRGYAYAARGYFDKPVEDLSWAEAALIAALPQSPSRMDPYDWRGRPRAVARGRRVLDSLLEEGFLNAAEHEIAAEQIGLLRMEPKRRRPEEAMHFVLRLLEEAGEVRFRESLEHRLIIESTLDLDLQREHLSIIGNAVAGRLDQGVRNGALIVVDLELGEIVSYVGSVDYFDARGAGSIDYARVLRSPGSTLKPLLYGLALERGTINPTSILDDLPHTREPVANADRRYLGPMLPRMALANSRNIPAMRLQSSVGLDEVHAFLRALDLHDGEHSSAYYGSGLSLGAMPVTLEGLIRSYMALAGDGRLIEPALLRGHREDNPRRVLSEDTVRQIGLYLSDPMARLPSFQRMGSLEYEFPVSVKTGTASGYRDAWAIAYSRRYLVGVWIGHPDWRPMNKVSGVRAAAPIARRVLVGLHESSMNDYSDIGFPPPEGSQPVSLCALTGQVSTPACDKTFVEWLALDDFPDSSCRAHLKVPIARNMDNGRATGNEEDAVTMRTIVDLGPRYAVWAASVGLVGPAVTGFTGASAEPRSIYPSHVTRETPVHPGAHSNGKDPKLSIVSPVAGRVLLRDPDTPRKHGTVVLEAVVDAPIPQVVWYVNGEPFEIVDYPFTARWPMRPGRHTFQVKTPRGRHYSEPVSVVVR